MKSQVVVPAERRHRERGQAGWIAPLVAVAVALGLAVSATSVWAIWQVPQRAATPVPAVSHAAGHQSQTPGTDSVTVAEDQILERRGEAVTTGNQAEFLADLDPTNKTLRSQQAAIFRGLTKLKFEQFSYAVQNSAQVSQLAARNYGVAAFIAPVVATYQLSGYDTGPVAEAQTVTFIKRGTRWWIGSDRDDQADLPAAGHAEPWDDGEVGVAHGKHSLVIGAVADQATLTQVAKAVDRAVAADLTFWPSGHGKRQWDGKVVVYAPEAQREFNSIFAGTKETADGVAAVTIRVLDHVDFTEGDGSYGTVGGSRVIINPKYFKPNSSFFNVILRHEISHVAAEKITSSGTPTWLVEGLAEYVGWRQASDPSNTFFARGVDSRTATAMNHGTFHVTLPSSRSFYIGSEATIDQRYTNGFIVCTYIQHRYGESALKSFATRMDAATTAKKEPAVLKSALQKTFGIDQDQLVAGVDSWIRNYHVGPR